MNLALSLDSKPTNHITMNEIFNRKMFKTLHHRRNSKDIVRKYSYSTDNSVNNMSNSHRQSNRHSHDRVLKFDMTFEKYLTEIETITDRRLHPSQRVKLKEAIENHDYKRLSSEQSRQHRSDFNSNRKYIISDWEEMTGNKWPTYDKPVYSNSGKMIRRVGDKFDAHHILENSWGGNNVAWNMIPARHPDQHQQQIHRPNGLADRIFN